MRKHGQFAGGETLRRTQDIDSLAWHERADVFPATEKGRKTGALEQRAVDRIYAFSHLANVPLSIVPML